MISSGDRTPTVERTFQLVTLLCKEQSHRVGRGAHAIADKAGCACVLMCVCVWECRVCVDGVCGRTGTWSLAPTCWKLSRVCLLQPPLCLTACNQC